MSAKAKLIDSILALKSNTYSANDLNEMTVKELKELKAEMIAEELTPEPELKADGGLVIPEQTEEQKAALAKLQAAAEPKDPTAPKAPRTPKGESKQAQMFLVFDAAHAAGENIKAAAKAAFPDSSDGVIASYSSYWRKDRGIVSERVFGNTAPKATKAEKALAALRKIYGDEVAVEAMLKDVQETAAIAAQTAADQKEAAAE